MSKLKQKSEFNIEAAKILLEKHLFAPSVHCSYYSCFQLLKYTIKNFFGEDYETQACNISLSRQSTHQYIIKYISEKLKNYTPFDERRNFKNNLKDLKQFRTDSDYENIEVDFDRGNKAYNIAREIRTYLIQNFKI